jgi:toxin ParE1/3/4
VRLRWAEGAVEDLQSTRDYLEAESPKAALDTVDRIMSAVERLEQFPQMGRIGRVGGSRELVVTGPERLLSWPIG